MNRIDRLAINKLLHDPNITNMSIVTYLSAVTMAKEKGMECYIEDFTTYKLYKHMSSLMPWIQKQSVYNAVDLLLDHDYLIKRRSSLDEDDHSITAVLQDMGPGFYESDEFNDSKGFIKLHSLFFTKEFYDAELRDKKVMLKFLSMLDNKANRRIPFNLSLKKNIEHLMAICKVNRFAHVVAIIKRIASFLGVTQLVKNTYQFYLAGKSLDIVESPKNVNAPSKNYNEKVLTYIKDTLDKFQEKYKEFELIWLSQGLDGFNYDVIKKSLIEYLTSRNRGTVIDEPAAYVRAIANRVAAEI